MKPKTMILMVVAVACGLGASYMTSKLLADRAKTAAPVDTVPVLVAKTRVPAWQAIKEPEKYFEIKQYPEDVAPKKALGDFEKVKDQRLRLFLEEGKPLTADDLVNKDQMGIDASILPGQRATAIRVTTEQIIGGFILPGSRVDVLCTLRDGEKATKLILQNMLVMAADAVDSKNPEVKNIQAQTITLAASPEEGARLALAANMGELRLLLRNPGDTERIAQINLRAADLDKPLSDPNKKTDDADDKPSPGTGTAKIDVPPAPPAEKEPEKPVQVEEEPKNAKTAPKAQPDDDEDRPAPRIQLNPPKPSKTHTMFIREGSKERKEQVRTKRDDETTKGEDDEEEAGPDRPAPVKKEDKPEPKPEKTNPTPAQRKGGSSTKTGRTRAGQ